MLEDTRVPFLPYAPLKEEDRPNTLSLLLFDPTLAAASRQFEIEPLLKGIRV
jgi:hypothetical protein